MKPLREAILAAIRARRGRMLPLCLLLATALLLDRIEHTPLLNIREAQFDQYQRLMPRVRDSEPVVVVGIDSQSLVKHGQWPWPRDLLAQLIAKIQDSQPLALGVDIVFAERDHYSPRVLAEHFPGIPDELLNTLPDPDQVLANTIAGHPTVLAVIGLVRPLPGSRQPANPLPAVSQNPGLEAYLPQFSNALTSRPLIEKAARGEGLINAAPGASLSDNERGVLRQVPSLGLINQLPFLSLPLEMLRVALGDGGRVVAESDSHGMTAIRVGDYRLPTQPDGQLLLHFGRASSNYYLSAADVLAGIHPPEIFNSRFVIIGFNSAGLQDRIVTPLGESLPGIDIHVQTIESLLNGQALKRPYWMPHLELAIFSLGGALLILAIPALRPRYAAIAFAGLTLTILTGGVLAFRYGSWLFDSASITLLLSPVFIALLGNTLIVADQRRRDAERQLQSSREEAARVNGELDAARRIQMGLLPDPDRLFANESRFDVAALLEPAHAVGGDYYDCFMLDTRHLCLAIGDVSGKGVPASLFMAISKTLTGTLLRRQHDLGRALQEIEGELARENPEYLFVTAFIGILNVETGELEYVCAGHDAPILLRQKSLLQIETSEIAGPPLCAAGDFPYVSALTRLQRGDLLCLFTDGVTEADNGRSMFGRQHLQETLANLGDIPLPTAVRHLRDTVRQFESGHPPSDDLTLLLMRWNGAFSEY